MTFVRWSLVSVLAAVALAASGAAARGEEPTEGLRSFTLRLDTPALEVVPAPDGFAELRLDGFSVRDRRPGAPEVPIRTFLVAIPPGAVPRLSVRPTAGHVRRDLVPRPVPRIVPAPSRDPADRSIPSFREILRPSEELYTGAGTLPERNAWLGDVGVLRDQRYVEVHLAPVRFDREAGVVLVDSVLEVTVHFDGAFEVSDSPAPSSRLESVYRRTFPNYAQGRRFRLQTPAPEAAPARGAAGGGFASTDPLRRIRVRQSGPVRLDHALFAAHAPEFLATDPRTWRLDSRGEQVPLHLHQIPGNDALLEPGEWVQFHGQKVDDEPETVPDFENPSNPFDNLYAVADFTDENAYFLSVSGQAQPTMTERDATPHNDPPVPDFVAVARAEIDDISTVPLPDEVWFWSPAVPEGLSRTKTIELPGLVSGTEPARFRVRIRGFPYDCVAVDPDHRSLVGLENDLAQPLVLPTDNPDNVGNQNVGEFDGNSIFVHDFEWTHSGADPQLTGLVNVTLTADTMDIPCSTIPTGNVINDLFFDSIEVEYRRAFTAIDDVLQFGHPDGVAEFTVTGFETDTVEVYEVTKPIGSSPIVDAVRLTGVTVVPDGPTYTARFRIEDDPELDPGTLRYFVAAASGSVPAPADFEPDRVSRLRSDTTQADLVVIVHPDLIDSECSEGGNPCGYDTDCTASPTDLCEVVPGGALDLLLAHRAAQGIDARVARIRDVEDEFNDGLAGPAAIRNFLAWLMAGGWGASPPSYVLLLGDGSQDYKAGTANGNFVPTRMMIKYSDFLAYYSADNQLAAVVGDDHLPEMAVGRIAVRTKAKANRILRRTLEYEQLTPAGAWRSHTLLISDRGKLRNGEYDAEEALEFEGMNDRLLDEIAGTAYTSTHLRYWTDNCCANDGCIPGTSPPYNCDPDQMREDIWDNVNGDVGDGAAIAQYVGHGNFDLWSDDAFFCTDPAVCGGYNDTDWLFNGLKAPWLIAHNCLTGGFHPLDDRVIGEQWHRRSSDVIEDVIGGAIAVYSPSGLGFRFIGKQVIDIIWDDVFGPHKERLLATPVLNSQVHLCSRGSIEACQYYTFLGDPSTRLRLPDIAAPSGLVATASTGALPYVDLSWDPSPTLGASYNVYRAEQPDGDYGKLNDDPIDGVTFTDNAVDHVVEYFYYVVATDGTFESAQSNFNTDCDQVPSDDCVSAQPFNYDPPSIPTGLAATDAETGGRLDLAWNENGEPDIDLYRIHYGKTASYGMTKDVASGTTTALTGLDDGDPYYLAIQAINSTGTESGISDPPVVATPNLVLGVTAPDLVSDLRVAKSGQDAVLTWSPVTQDIYGKPKTVSHYEVFRSTATQYVPSPANRIGMPTPPAFNDAGALDPADPDYFYLVRAIDPDGNPGGVGNQLPAGILDLEIARSATPGALVLSWSPVTTDFDGNPTQITHYEVYAANAPFTRAQIEAGAIDLLVPAVAGTSVEIVPLGPVRHYSVLAVDTRGNRSPF